MKYKYIALFIMTCSGALAQNELSTPTGQNLKISSDTVVASGSLKVSNTVSISNNRFLGIKKTAAGDLNTMVGPNSGNYTMTGKWNAFFGENTGMANTTGSYNTFLGTFSGSANTTGTSNTFVGYKSGLSNIGGLYNVFIGNLAGQGNASGGSNIFMGLDCGYSNTIGSSNVFIGRGAGYYYTTGSNNTMVGTFTGTVVSPVTQATGSGNVFLGNRAGHGETGSNKLYIANSNTTQPLVYGEFPPSATVGGKFVINGQVGIGVTTFPTSATGTSGSVNTSAYQLFVNGGALVKDMVVSATWADYVFEKDYRLKPLEEVEGFINANGHLPNMPSALEIEEKGLNLGDMARRQQEKIEELTLYMIEHEKMIKRNDELIQRQEEQIKRITELVLNQKKK
jgi:hypothetical protein